METIVVVLTVFCMCAFANERIRLRHPTVARASIAGLILGVCYMAIEVCAFWK